MAKITFYQKPTCSTCRDALKYLKDAGAEVEAINYYERPFTAALLKTLLKKGGLSPRDVMRPKEDIYKSLQLGTKTMTDDELIAVMVANPDLIQRPIVEKGDKVILGRPAETVTKILKA
ncbi:MAG: arsenate reductase (glutaredoxin) [Nitrospiraceae bacterium]